jgi:hypothetical protein
MNDGDPARFQDCADRADMRVVATSKAARARGRIDLHAALVDVARVTGCLQPGRQWFPHPFPARMPFEVAQRAVERFTTVGQVVLDPMSGSGTIPFAALNSRRSAIGRDIDPLAVLLGRALCETVHTKAFEAYCADIHDEATARARGRRSLQPILRDLNDEARQFLSYWFPERALAEMFALAETILADAKNRFATIGAVILSSLVISRDSGVSLALDLSRSRPHRVESKKPRIPLQLWREKSSAFSKFYANRASRTNLCGADISLGDARALDIPSNTVDAVITSPPYVNAIDYIRTSKFALIFFGARLDVLREIRSRAIGTEVGLPKGELPKGFDLLVERKVRDKSRRPIIRRYLYDLRYTLLESMRVLKPGAPAIFVLGPSIASRKAHDSVPVLSRIASDVGFEVVGHSRRNISSVNRSMPPPNKAKRRQNINRRMTCEYYLALRKPLA